MEISPRNNAALLRFVFRARAEYFHFLSSNTRGGAYLCIGRGARPQFTFIRFHQTRPSVTTVTTFARTSARIAYRLFTVPR